MLNLFKLLSIARGCIRIFMILWCHYILWNTFFLSYQGKKNLKIYNTDYSSETLDYEVLKPASISYLSSIQVPSPSCRWCISLCILIFPTLKTFGRWEIKSEVSRCDVELNRAAGGAISGIKIWPPPVSSPFIPRSSQYQHMSYQPFIHRYLLAPYNVMWCW